MDHERISFHLMNRLVGVPREVEARLKNLQTLNELPIGDRKILFRPGTEIGDPFFSFALPPGLQALKTYEYELTEMIEYGGTSIEEKIELAKKRELVRSILHEYLLGIVSSGKGVHLYRLPELLFCLDKGWVMHAFKKSAFSAFKGSQFDLLT